MLLLRAYIVFLILDATVLLGGGIAGLVETSSDEQKTAQFIWCLVSVLTCSPLAMMALLATDCPPTMTETLATPVATKYLQATVHCFATVAKIVLYGIGISLYSDEWYLFQTVFLYFTAFFVVMSVLLARHFCAK